MNVAAASTLSTRPQPLAAVLRVVGWVGLGLIAVVVALSDFVASAPAGATAMGPVLLPPSIMFQFGTDMLGRDMVSETLHGLSMTARAVVPSALIALIFGALSGFATARLPIIVAQTLRWIIGILAALPALLVAILIIALTTRGWAIIAAGLAAAPMAFVRAFDRTCVQARAAHSHFARATGISAATLLRRDLVYEFSAAFASNVARALAAVTIILSTVSFLGFGAEPPHRDLGLMIAAARAYYLHAWWTAAFPALGLMAVVLFARLAAGLVEGERP